MKRLLLSLLLTALCLPLGAQVAVKYNGTTSRRTEPTDLKTPTGMAETFEAGSTLTINGTLSGTPTGGTLNLSNVTVTGLPFGSGTVTSFSAGDLSPLFTTSEATVTTTPALTFALSNAAQNTVFAGPTSGTGAPSYRALVAGDIPNLASIYQPLSAVLTATTASFTTVDEAKLDAITGTNTGDQTITLTGDVTGSGTGSFAATIQANSVALTTDTSGDYVATITGDTEVTVSGAGTEGRAVTLAIGSAIARDQEVTDALAAHTGDTTDAHAASAITNTPAGNIAATTVQAALNELDGDKAAAAHAHAGEDITSGTVADARIASTIARDTEVATAVSDERTATATLSGKTIAHDAAPGSDDTFTGDTITGLNNSGGVTQWDVVYLNGSSQWVLADANGTGTYPAAGLAVATVSTGNATTVMVRGVVRNDAWTWTPGGRLYLSATAGGLTQTAPATSGDKVQDVGFALSADVAWINFDGVYVEVD